MFFTWKRDGCETFDASISRVKPTEGRAGLAGRPSIIPLLLKHRNESVTPYYRGELQWNPFGQAWKAEEEMTPVIADCLAHERMT